MPRGARLDAPGTLHHVIIRGIEKRRIVDDDQDRKNFIDRLGRVSVETETKILAWSLLKNHAHILLKSGPRGLSQFMRRFLTGYAVGYNLRHRRHGHLFQNRYKSIVCDEDAYFQELVRYIHLNPLRAGLVNNLGELERYPWCGHGVMLGKIQHSWQDRPYVLSWFGRRKKQASNRIPAVSFRGGCPGPSARVSGRRVDSILGRVVRGPGKISARGSPLIRCSNFRSR